MGYNSYLQEQIKRDFWKGVYQYRKMLRRQDVNKAKEKNKKDSAFYRSKDKI